MVEITASLVASFPDGSRLGHPITDEASLARVYGWLSPLVESSQVTWFVVEGDAR